MHSKDYKCLLTGANPFQNYVICCIHSVFQPQRKIMEIQTALDVPFSVMVRKNTHKKNNKMKMRNGGLLFKII